MKMYRLQCSNMQNEAKILYIFMLLIISYEVIWSVWNHSHLAILIKGEEEGEAVEQGGSL